MSDLFEIYGYFFGFWFFIFNKKYRQKWIKNFKEEDFIGKLMELFGFVISITIGAMVPILLFTQLI